ncbi:hypothetical protein ACFC00_36610 [Streptomyces adustus]|uniref:hypothetical protein n=1 Tax=Streptomyces adustus TaxID=1609272 RepID=UPI0035DC9801
MTSYDAHPEQTRQPNLRLRRGTVVVPGQDGLIVASGRHKHSFRGSAARHILPDVLARLDRATDPFPTTADPAAPSGLTEELADRLLTLLHNRDLLEESSTCPPGTQSHIANFYAQTLSELGGYAGSAHVLNRLRACALIIIGDGDVVEALGADLTSLGVRVTTVDTPEQITQAQARLHTPQPDLAIIVDDGRPATDLSGAHRACLELDLPLLRMALAGGSLELGPLIDGGTTACPACLDRGRQEAGWPASHPASAATALDRDLLAGLATSEITAILLNSAATRPHRTLTRITPAAGHNTETFLVTPYPGCSSCGQGIGAVGAQPSAHDVFEWAKSSPPVRLAPHRGAWKVRERRLRDVSTMRAPRSTHPRTRLPTWEEGALPARFLGDVHTPRTGPITAVELSMILNLTAGFHVQDVGTGGKRYTPSGGNFGSPSVLCVTDTIDLGLPGTVFRYGDTGHEILAQHPDRVALVDFLRHTDITSENCTAALVIVTERARLAQKYGDFAHRLGLLDAGCALTQLAAVCDALGIGLEIAASWSHEVTHVLEVDRRTEFIAAIAGLTTAGGR